MGVSSGCGSRWPREPPARSGPGPARSPTASRASAGRAGAGPCSRRKARPDRSASQGDPGLPQLLGGEGWGQGFDHAPIPVSAASAASQGSRMPGSIGIGPAPVAQPADPQAPSRRGRGRSRTAPHRAGEGLRQRAPASTSSSRARSSTVRAIGPSVASVDRKVSPSASCRAPDPRSGGSRRRCRRRRGCAGDPIMSDPSATAPACRQRRRRPARRSACAARQVIGVRA